MDIWANTEITDYATMTGNNLYLFSVTFQVIQVGYVQDCIQVWTKNMADLFLVDYPDSDFPGNKPYELKCFRFWLQIKAKKCWKYVHFNWRFGPQKRFNTFFFVLGYFCFTNHSCFKIILSSNCIKGNKHIFAFCNF